MTTISVEYSVTLEVTEDSPAPTEEDIRDAILHRAIEDGIGIMAVMVERV